MTLARREFREYVNKHPKRLDLAHGMTLCPCQDSAQATEVLRQSNQRILAAFSRSHDENR
jgi:hypothetical protein